MISCSSEFKFNWLSYSGMVCLDLLYFVPPKPGNPIYR